MNSSNFRIKEVPWLETGLEMLGKQGVNSLTIKSLSDKVGVSRTSFYFLFENVDNYFVQLARYWYNKGTVYIFNLVDQNNNPIEKFKLLISLIYDDEISGLAWLQLRQIGLKNEEVRDIVIKAEKHRADSVMALFEGIGNQRKDAEINAEFFMYAIHGWTMLNWHNHNEDVLSNIKIQNIMKKLKIID